MVVPAGQLGVGMGYHRLICHGGYRTAAPLRYLLTLFGVLACQGGPC
jgi:fatty-acid desaturase